VCPSGSKRVRPNMPGNRILQCDGISVCPQAPVRVRRAKWLLMLLNAIVPVLLGDSCDADPNSPGIQHTCLEPAPRLAGTWATSLQDRQLSIILKEQCRAYIGGTSWWIEGSWNWSGQQGDAFGLTHASGVDVYLSMGAPNQPRSTVTLYLSTPVPVTASSVNGFARGTWRLPTDTTRIVGSFDDVALTLQRK
jgi:hypothetical protein